jgi:hypothetical protein
MSKLWLVIPVLLIAACIGQALTPEQVMQQKDNLLDKTITVIGKAEVGRQICTLAVCNPDTPCCNTCSGSLMLSGGANITLAGGWQNQQVGCGGTNCIVSCWPMQEGKTYSVTGVWNKSYGEYALEVKSFEDVK